MFARISAKFLILAASAACVFFGIGLLGLALASALADALGPAGAYALTGAILLVPVLLWGLVLAVSRPRRPPPPPPSNVMTLLIGALARQSPVMAAVATGLTGVVEMFLNRHRSEPD